MAANSIRGAVNSLAKGDFSRLFELLMTTSFKTILWLGLFLGLVLLGTNSYAVMNPNLAARQLGVPNGLMRKTMGQFMEEGSKQLVGLNFRVPPSVVSFAPYVTGTDEITKDHGDLLLNSLFLSIFRDVPKARFVEYHSIFFGYDESKIVWGLPKDDELSPVSRLFQLAPFDDTRFTIYLPASLKTKPRLLRFAKLAALMRHDLDIQTVAKFGGWRLLFVHFEKVLWIGDVYTSMVLYELMSHFQNDEFGPEIDQLYAEGALGEFDEIRNLVESVLSPSELTSGLNKWIDAFFLPRAKTIGEFVDEFTSLGTAVGNAVTSKARRTEWSDQDFSRVLNTNRARLKRWWSKVPSERRFRILHDARQMRDGVLDKVLLDESITPGKCDSIITDTIRGSNETLQ